MVQTRPGRSIAQQHVARLLETARESLGMGTAFLTRMEGVTQYLEVVESTIPGAGDGMTLPQETTFCQWILDGKLPGVIPDVTLYPDAMELPTARDFGIRSFVSVPVVFSDGTVYGTFCIAEQRVEPDLRPRDGALMKVLAQAAATVLEPEIQRATYHDEVAGRLQPLIAAGGPAIAFQPIVGLRDQVPAGVEALSRFPADWGLAPDLVFAQAHDVGVGARLELLAIEKATTYLRRLPGYLSINISPQVLMTPAATTALSRLPLERVVLELSEHDPVADYDELVAVLDPLLAHGLRLAIDDVGAGFSSLMHIIQTRPNMLKLDRSMVAGVSDDTVRATLVDALVHLAQELGATTVAEGIEEPADAQALVDLGVNYGQGWHFGRPQAADQLPTTAPR